MKFWLPFVLGNVLLTTSVANQNLNVRKSETLEQSHIRTTKRAGKTFSLKVSFVYENSNGKKWKLDKNLINDAVEIVSNVFENLNVKIVSQSAIEITDDPLFATMRKSTDVLKIFLKNKQRLMNSKHIENLQLITTKTLGLDHALAGVATFQTVCSPESSGGIIISKPHWEKSHLAVIMAYNLACIMGISKKKHCRNGFRETDTKCRSNREPLTTNEITKCIMKELDVELKHYNLNALCEENRTLKMIPQNIQQTADDDDDDIDDEQKSSKLVLISLALGGGGFLLIMIAVTAYKLKKNYDKGRFLKDRISVKYNYEAGTRRYTRPSVINDPTITDDLELK